jgi:hypothetical protein
MPALNATDPYATTAIQMISIGKDAIDNTRSNELIFNHQQGQENITIQAQRDFTQVIQNDALTIIEGTCQTQVRQGDMTIDIAQGALHAKAADPITLQVGESQIKLSPSSLHFIAPAIAISPTSAGTASASPIETHSTNPDSTKTKTYGAIQNDLLASNDDLVSSNQKNSTPVQSLDASNTIMCNTHPTKAPSNLLGTCDFYTWRNEDFIKRHQGCDHLQPPDYYLNYGTKNCRLFSTQLYPKLSEQGKAWLVKARLYLQEAIEDLLQKNPDIELDNDKFRDAVFETHPDAYERAGIQYLPITDIGKIFWTPDKSTIFKLDADKQAAIIFAVILSEKYGEIEVENAELKMNQDTLYQESMKKGGGGIREYLTYEGIRKDELTEY